MEETRISSWNDLMDALYEGAWMPDIRRFRSPFAFRGLPDVQYNLATSLMRLGGNYADLEGHLLRNFKKYAHRDVVQRDSYWHWLSVAQHHGLPTRLLDWTFSPLVALHFLTASIDMYDRDGLIWCVNYRRAHECLPEALKNKLTCEGADIFTVEMLTEIESLVAFDRLSGEADPFALFFEPPSLDDRIVNQYAMFSVLSSPAIGMDTWLESHPDLCRRIIVPASLKWEIRDKLDQANINERVLFPGLDGLSLWLKRMYFPLE
ncbi:FRG domain-containing protein [Tellurirhabdus rosea]|uniref:FRG domain-containing protein n=1 Tax=Tellurirhabdus rosea TaxID=2674997 RepID=UPI00225A15E8|nr:FRG domain-containing protein [Tellurirhabdus rosea]